MKIGVQLYSMHDVSTNLGLAESIKRAHEYGYDSVEFADYFGLSTLEILTINT